MRRILIVPAALLLIATGSGFAFAAGDDDGQAVGAPRGEWMTVAEITAKFIAKGYDVRQVKEEDGAYELYAIDKDGRHIEADVDPVTGEVLRSETGE